MPRKPGDVIVPNDKVKQPIAVQVHEERSPAHCAIRPQSGRIRHVGESGRVAGAVVDELVAEESRQVAALAKQIDVEIPVAVVVSDRGSVAEIALHALLDGVVTGKCRSVGPREVEADVLGDVHAPARIDRNQQIGR